jgi:hypothetical protein
MSFVVLMTPRDFWHDCHHDHDHSSELKSDVDFSNNDSSSSELEENCFVCDFDLGLFTAGNPTFFSFIERIHSENSVRLLSRLETNKPSALSLRGPPVTC